MNKIKFESLPSKKTPLSPEILNTMQSNIEESCVAVSPTQPETNEKVWIQKGKNLFDINTMVELVGKFRPYDLEGVIASNDSINGIKFPVEPNSTYTFSSDSSSNSNIAFYDKNFNYISGNAFANEKTFTTPENCHYVTMAVENNYTWIQVEQGSTATEYEAYVDKKIWCKNDNGEFEEFVNQTEIEKTLEDLKGKLLWSNGSYTSAFVAQTVNIDLSDYNFIRVIYTHWGGSWSFLDGGKVPKGVMSMLNPSASTSRRYTSNNEGVTFENPANDGNTLAQVPIYIIGYKYW